MKNLTLAFVSLIVTIHVWALPAQIVIVRHGEKIDDTYHDLSAKGCERAFQLTEFFKNYSSTVAIYGQGIKKSTGSIRPLETIAPTAKMFGLKINNSYLKDDISAVTNEIMTAKNYDGKTVLISWEHAAIINLASAFGVQLSNQLQLWPGSVFDQAWIITYPTNDSKKATLQIVAEHVLPTDISNEQSGVANWGSETTPSDNGLIVPTEVIKTCANGNQLLDQIVQKLVMKPLPN